MKANVFIAASAGTGKTQALAERLIALVKGGLEWGNYFQLRRTSTRNYRQWGYTG